MVFLLNHISNKWSDYYFFSFLFSLFTHFLFLKQFYYSYKYQFPLPSILLFLAPSPDHAPCPVLREDETSTKFVILLDKISAASELSKATLLREWVPKSQFLH